MVETKAEAAEPGLIVGKWVKLDQPINVLDLKEILGSEMLKCGDMIKLKRKIFVFSGGVSGREGMPEEAKSWIVPVRAWRKKTGGDGTGKFIGAAEKIITGYLLQPKTNDFTVPAWGKPRRFGWSEAGFSRSHISYRRGQGVTVSRE